MRPAFDPSSDYGARPPLFLNPKAFPPRTPSPLAHRASDFTSLSPRHRSAPPRGLTASRGLTPPPPPRTKWTRRVPHPVPIGHAASPPRAAQASSARSASGGSASGRAGSCGCAPRPSPPSPRYKSDAHLSPPPLLSLPPVQIGHASLPNERRLPPSPRLPTPPALFALCTPGPYQRGEVACPISTGDGTRRVRSIRGAGEWGGG
jgi:hypothetical protein